MTKCRTFGYTKDLSKMRMGCDSDKKNKNYNADKKSKAQALPDK